MDFTKGTLLPSIHPNKEISLDTNIYRIIPKHRLFELFETYQNVLVRPKLWDDTFENLALQSKILINGEKGQFGFRNDIYAQCWTLETANDAMWRIYSKVEKRVNGQEEDRTDGIRIKTTVGKLLDGLVANKGDRAHNSCFIGRVSYSSVKGLKNFADKHFAKGLDRSGRNIAQSLLIKRNAFKHENEVRIIFLSPNNTPIEKDLYLYDQNPHQLIDQIMVHPQLKKEDADNLKEEIKKRTRFKKNKQSGLYWLPKGFVFKVGGG